MSCGNKTHFQIEGFENYYSSFVINTNVSTNDLIIKFGDLWAQNYIGMCTSGRETPTVIIDRYNWEYFSEEDRQELIDHELGHCVLGRLTHDDSLLPTGAPKSIMNSHHFDPKIIVLNKAYYYKELVK